MRRASLLESRSPGWTLPMVAAFALSMAGVATVEAQTTDENGRRLYLYAAEDFGIDPTEVTFARDIAPILQRSCQNCHRPGGAGPMSLVTYEEVRPWARAIMRSIFTLMMAKRIS